MNRIATHLPMLLVIGLLGSARAGDELSMQDLVALDKAKQWTELLDRAERVKPAARTADWTKLVTAAATHVVDQIERTSSSGLHEAAAMVEVIPAAELRYTFLVSDAHYLAGKAKLLDGVTAACLHEARSGCGAFAAALATGITKFPRGTAQRIALLVGDDVSLAEAAHFWMFAVDDDKDACTQAPLARSVVGALRESAAANQIADAQHVAATCYSALERALLDELVASKDDAKDRPRFLINACPVLKTHGTSTIAKKRKCP
jgi:hypothetical protein